MHILSSAALLQKRASIGGGGGETEFERAFASLAYTYLKDKSPRLLDHVVGFQLVDRNEDNTKAMGVFGVKVGNLWLYAPMFFLNGDLKGHELLYVKNSDTYLPHKENWVNYLLSKSPHQLGEVAQSGSVRDLGGLSPDIRAISGTDGTGLELGKWASDAHWLRPVLPMLAAVRTKRASSLYRGRPSSWRLNQRAVVESPWSAALAECAPVLDLNRVMPDSLPLLKSAHAMYEAVPAIREGLRKFYGPDCLSRWGRELREKAAQDAASLLPTKKAPVKTTTPGSLLIADKPKPVEKRGQVRMYVYEEVITGKLNPNTLSPEEKERLQKETVLVQDDRSDTEISRAYNIREEMQLSNPTETGIYQVLTPDGFQEAFVSVRPQTGYGVSSLSTAVALPGGRRKKWHRVRTNQLFVRDADGETDWESWYGSLPTADSLQAGASYVLICKDKQTSVPFYVVRRTGDDRYTVEYLTRDDSPQSSVALKNRGLSSTFPEEPTPSNGYGTTIIRRSNSKFPVQTLRSVHDELLFPADCKVLQLKPAPPSAGGLLMDCGCDDVEETPEEFQLGTMADVDLRIREKTARLKLVHTGTDVFVSSPKGDQLLSKKAAFFDLVGNHGFREKVAREMLQQAEEKGKAVYRVKYHPYYMQQKVAYPAPYSPQEDQLSVESFGPRTQSVIQRPIEDRIPIEELSSSNTDPAVWDNWQNYEAEDFQKTIQMAQQASSQGQKEVFDTAMVSSLLKSVQQDSMIGRYLGSLMKALDALGRLLMNFYWHQEEFEDRYGKSDMPELEDGLRNAMEALGDITLFLKEKTIESPLDIGEIDLDDIARN